MEPFTEKKVKVLTTNRYKTAAQISHKVYETVTG